MFQIFFLCYIDCDKTRFSRFFFLEALISERYVRLLAGNWWKLAYDQIRDDRITKAQSAKASKKGFLGFCFKYFRDFCDFCVTLQMENAVYFVLHKRPFFAFKDNTP